MNYTLDVSAEEAQIIINTLAEKPYHQVHQLVRKIIDQIEDQQKPQVVESQAAEAVN